MLALVIALADVAAPAPAPAPASGLEPRPSAEEAGVASPAAPPPREKPKGDASAGRLDGDMAFEGGLGATFGPRAPRATLDLRLRYLQTAGAFATYEDGPLVGATSSDPRRVVAGGLEVRPLFLARMFTGLEWSRPYPDLVVDSFALELGAVFGQPLGGAFGKPGLQCGIGVEVPIFPRASGLWLSTHAGARWSDAALSGRPLAGPADRSLYLSVTIGWQQVFGAHVVDVGDQAPR